MLDTTLTLDLLRPLSVFFADSATHFSAVALEHDETAADGNARVQLLNLIPDAAGDAVTVEVAGQEPITDGLAYRAATPYREYPIPQGGQLYVNVYTKAAPETPIVQSSISVQAGHNYLLVLRGYTQALQTELPGGDVLTIQPNPILDIINTL